MSRVDLTLAKRDSQIGLVTCDKLELIDGISFGAMLVVTQTAFQGKNYYYELNVCCVMLFACLIHLTFLKSGVHEVEDKVRPREQVPASKQLVTW